MKKMVAFYVLSILTMSVFSENKPKAATGAPAVSQGSNQASGIQNDFNKISEDEVVAYLKGSRVQEYNYLVKLKETNPEKYKEGLSHYKMMMFHEKMAFGGNTEMFNNIQKMRQNQQKLYTLSEDWKKNTDNTKKDALKKEMMDILSENFDINLKQEKLRIEAMKKRIEEQQKSLEEKTGKKQELIESNFNMIVSFRQTPAGVPQMRNIRPEGPDKRPTAGSLATPPVPGTGSTGPAIASPAEAPEKSKT